MRKLLIFYLYLFIPLVSIAQKTDESKLFLDYRTPQRILAEEQILQLKTSALLVRLKTRENSIAALRKRGQNKLADKIEARQLEYNKSIVEAFQKHFTFCPSYFFFSEQSALVKNKDFDKVQFLSTDLMVDTAIKMNHENYFIGEFGNIEQDTAKYYSGYDYSSGAKTTEERTEYRGGLDFGFGALIIKSEQFIQLRKPFPYYTRTFKSLIIERSVKNVVKRMNIKLNYFYRQSGYK